MYPFSIAAIPLYQQINISVLAASVLILVIACLLGAKRRGLFHAPPTPPESVAFPLPMDYLLTILILGLIAFINVSGAMAVHADNAGKSANPTSWLDPIFFFAIHIPILIRLYQTAGLEPRIKIGLGRSMGTIALAFLLTMCSNAFVQASPLQRWFTVDCGSPKTQEAITIFQEHDWLQLLPLIISAVVVAPIVEECLFRGMLYPCLKRFVSPIMAAILCGLVFGTLHMALPQVLALTVLGIFLCVVYERTKSLLLPILIHACVNGVAVAVAIFLKDIEAALKALDQT